MPNRHFPNIQLLDQWRLSLQFSQQVALVAASSHLLFGIIFFMGEGGGVELM